MTLSPEAEIAKRVGDYSPGLATAIKAIAIEDHRRTLRDYAQRVRDSHLAGAKAIGMEDLVKSPAAEPEDEMGDIVVTGDITMTAPSVPVPAAPVASPVAVAPVAPTAAPTPTSTVPGWLKTAALVGAMGAAGLGGAALPSLVNWATTTTPAAVQPKQPDFKDTDTDTQLDFELSTE